MNRRWLMVPIVAGAVALTIVGGIALAHRGAPVGVRGDVTTGVAAILGVDQAEVQAAFSQAAAEQQQASLQSRLDKLVEQGRLTQQQADEYTGWFLSRPEGLEGPGLKRFGGLRSHGNSGELADRVGEILGVDGAIVEAAIQQASGEARDAQVSSKLDRAVEGGRLTQEQVDQHWEKYQARSGDDSPHRRFGRDGLRGFGKHGLFGVPSIETQPSAVTLQSL
jgi:multidrug efflux pump subunit AcrA (membrane-fusion protein)